MATKTFGAHDTDKQSTQHDYAAELYSTVGVIFPLSLSYDSNGNLIGASYETEWHTGGTEPVTNAAGEVTDYKENYENKKLSADQIKQVDSYLAENIKLQS